MDENSQEYQRVYDLLFNLGKAYLEKGRYDEAIEKFTKLIELSEENEQIYLNLSKAYLLKEQFDEQAIQIFQRTLAYDPANKVINVILSEIYLSQKREDQEASQVYRNAIQYNPQNAKELALALIKIDYRNGNYQSAKLLAEQVLQFDPNNSELVSYYTYLGWKEEAYDQVSEILKGILRKSGDLAVLRWLILNYMKMIKNTTADEKEFQFTNEDIQYCDKFLKSIEQLSQLDEIFIYLVIKKIIANYFVRNDNDQKLSISEYELFLSENSLSNVVWDRGLNKTISINRSFSFAQEIWNKLSPQTEISTELPTDDHNGPQIDHDDGFSNLNTLMLIQFINYDDLIGKTNFKEIMIKFDTVLHEILDRTSAPALNRIDDGYLIFWNDVIPAISAATHILENSLDLNLKLHICIHYRTADAFLDDLISIFNIQQLCTDILSVKNTGTSDNVDFADKICITESVYNLVKNDPVTKPLKKISFAGQPNSIPLYEIVWQNPLDRLRKGIVKKINRFQIINEIFINDIFNSYKAVDTFLDRLVILKVLRPDHIETKGSQFSQTFFDEASKIGKLNHNNIAIIYDISEDEGFYYIAREFIEGVPLTVLLSEDEKTDWRQYVEIFLQIGEGLKYAHYNGIIHGRLKPANIFISENQEIKIMDFIIPGFSVANKNQPGLDLQGISYASPEQIANKEIDHRSDIYSLGVILYSLLTGENPFYTDDVKKLFNNIKKMQPPKVSTKNTAFSTEIDAIIEKAIAKSPADRYENVEQFMNEIRNLW